MTDTSFTQGLVSLESSFLAQAGYDEPNRALTIVMKSGARYVYEDVPADVAKGLFNATSPGRYYASSIKGQFPATGG